MNVTTPEELNSLIRANDAFLKAGYIVHPTWQNIATKLSIAGRRKSWTEDAAGYFTSTTES